MSLTLTCVVNVILLNNLQKSVISVVAHIYRRVANRGGFIEGIFPTPCMRYGSVCTYDSTCITYTRECSSHPSTCRIKLT